MFKFIEGLPPHVLVVEAQGQLHINQALAGKKPCPAVDGLAGYGEWLNVLQRNK